MPSHYLYEKLHNYRQESKRNLYSTKCLPSLSCAIYQCSFGAVRKGYPADKLFNNSKSFEACMPILRRKMKHNETLNEPSKRKKNNLQHFRNKTKDHLHLLYNYTRCR